MIKLRVDNIRSYFRFELTQENFVTDKTGQLTIELLGASFIADEEAIFGTPNQEYIQKELKWYNSQSLNINDIYGKDREPPKAWQIASNKYGEINSNYGYLIYSPVNHYQYNNALYTLVKDPDSRRATMVYTRPSMHIEFNSQNKNDFICTNAVSYYIRDNKMHCAVQMRSNDVVFGYKNDWAWQQHVFDSLIKDYNTITNENIEKGDMFWQVQNLHVYSRHFNLVDPNWKEK